jgi:hypothetical protein
MKNIHLFLFFCFLFFVFSTSSLAVGVWKPASLIQLSIKPDESEGELVLVSGYFVISRGDPNRLFLSKDSYLANTPDHLLVDKVNDSDFLKNCGTRCYAKVIGTYTRKKYGSPEYIGGIIEVEKVIFLNNDD